MSANKPTVPALTSAGTKVSAVVEPGRNRRISPVTTLDTNSVPAGVAAMLSGKKLSPGTVRLNAFDQASRSKWVDAVAAGAHDTRVTARQSATNGRAGRFMRNLLSISLGPNERARSGDLGQLRFMSVVELTHEDSLQVVEGLLELRAAISPGCWVRGASAARRRSAGTRGRGWRHPPGPARPRRCRRSAGRPAGAAAEGTPPRTGRRGPRRPGPRAGRRRSSARTGAAPR